METIRELIAASGGLELLPERSPLRVDFGPDNYLEIADAGTSPTGLVAVALTIFRRTEARWLLGRMLLEKTDLGFLPFYLFNTKDSVEKRVYVLDRNNRIRRVNRHIRSDLVAIAAVWDEEIAVRIPYGGGIVQT